MMPADNVQPTNGKGDSSMNGRKIIVMGASAGGFDAFQTIIKNLPPDFATPIFLVWHMSADAQGILPEVLNGINKIPAAHAYDGEPIKPKRIYVAPPDYHMIVEQGQVRIMHGPKENRFRPAIDPLFRSAAYVYTNHVIGVILTGGLDDGTAGLWTIKQYGGTAIVQNPQDAEVPSMPGNALREVQVDHCVALSEIAALLVCLANEPVTQNAEIMKDEQTRKEIDIAAGQIAMKRGILQFNDLSPYTCPECHGVLSKLRNGNITRYRCHTGHAYSADSLLAAITEKIEDGLYNALRGMDESVLFLNHLGDHYAESNQPRLAAIYFKKANETQDRSLLVRKAVITHEQFNKDSLRKQADTENSQIEE